MARGGLRAGAGRKPRERGKVAVFAPRLQGPVASEVPSVPPADLPEDQREFWRLCAVRAIDQGTLTLDTVAAFRLLCELDAERRATKEIIDRDGRTYIKVTIDGAGQEHQELKAHPLKSDYSRLAKAVEGLMGRFKLAPFGKAETRQRTQPAASNPWAQVAGQ